MLLMEGIEGVISGFNASVIILGSRKMELARRRKKEKVVGFWCK